MNANFYTGKVKVNNQYVKVPYAYIANSASTTPPFACVTQYGATYVNLDQTVNYPQAVWGNTDSPLMVCLNGQAQGIWATIYNNPSYDWTRIQLSEGYMLARKNPSYTDPRAIEVDYYNNNDQRLGGGSWAIIASDIFFACFTVLKREDGVLLFEVLYILVSSSTRHELMIRTSSGGIASLGLCGSGYEPHFKSVKSLSLAAPSDLGLPGMPVLPDTSQRTMLLSYIPDEYLEDEQVTGGSHFVIKPPSLGDFIGQYNDSSFTSRSIFLESGNYVTIGRKSTGVQTNQYKFTFKSRADISPSITYFETTITTSLLLDGSPYLGFLIDEINHWARLNVIFLHTSIDPSTGIKTQTVDYNTISMDSSDMTSLYAWLHTSAGEEEDSDSGAENPEQGGNETDEIINTPLNRPTLPTRGAVGSGFVKVYEVGDTELQDICEFMWDDSLIANLGRLFSDPREIIVGLMVFPITPLHTTSNSPIYAGNLDTGVTGNLLTNEYETRFAGARRVPKGNNDFMSFAPYRRIKINIPYCGEHELDPSAVFGATLKLYYHVSFFSGNCIAEITRTFDGGEEEPIAFYGGQMGYSIPLSSEDFTRTLSSLISAGVTIGTALCTYGASSAAAATSKKAAVAAARQGSANSALTGSVAGAAGGLLNGSLAPNVSYNSGGGANSGFLGCQQPYLIIDEAITAYDKDQSSYIGYTSYQTKKLSDCVGYTKCLEAHIEGVHASDSELEEIMNWLTNGVLIHQDGSATPSTTPIVSGNTVITVMKLTSERNVIGKKWSGASQIEGQLIYDQSITSPSILVNGNSIDFNYAYIGLFNRFYFVSDVIVRNKDLIEVKLKSDPLQSFKEEILNCYASVDRQKHNGNKFIDDPYMWTQVNNNVKILPFIDDGIPFDFGHSEDSYILTIAGKG